MAGKIDLSYPYIVVRQVDIGTSPYGMFVNGENGYPVRWDESVKKYVLSTAHNENTAEVEGFLLNVDTGDMKADIALAGFIRISISGQPILNGVDYYLQDDGTFDSTPGTFEKFLGSGRGDAKDFLIGIYTQQVATFLKLLDTPDQSDFIGNEYDLVAVNPNGTALEFTPDQSVAMAIILGS